MANSLIPPPELDPPMRSGATPADRIAHWMEVMDALEQFHIAGLRLRVGPNGDWRAAYRRSYEDEMREHDETMLRMMQRFADAERNRQRAGELGLTQDLAAIWNEALPSQPFNA